MNRPTSLVVFVDTLYLEGQVLNFSGWVVGPYHIKAIELVLGGVLRLPIPSYGLSSPDVASIYGPNCREARFSEKIILSENVTMVAITQAVLHVKCTADPSLSYKISPLHPSLKLPYRPTNHSTRISGIRLGIGVTTFNRKSVLLHTIEKIRQNSCLDYVMVVADDGSSDGTREALADRNVNVVGGKNRGVAWNKNRALFYLSRLQACDVVILLEDDTYPDQIGWESNWILGALSYGHCNFLPPWFGGSTHGGFGQWFDPSVSLGKVSGQCSAFSSEALNWVGYLDSRFGKYGFEHAEHSMRMIRGGFGGYRSVGSGEGYYYYLISGGLSVLPTTSSGNEDLIHENALIMQQIQDDGIYRSPWRNDAELATLHSELSTNTKFIR